MKDYQQAKGLQVDGVVGPETRGSLNGSAAGGGGGGASAPAPASSTSSSGQAIVDAARSQVGVTYSWGTSKPGVSFDCSGLSSYAYAQAGIDLPRTSSQQEAAGTTISKSEAQPGDLVVWPGHLGIYAGGDTVIDAGNSAGSVKERTIWGIPPSSPSAEFSDDPRRALHHRVGCAPFRHLAARRRADPWVLGVQGTFGFPSMHGRALQLDRGVLERYREVRPDADMDLFEDPQCVG